MQLPMMVVDLASQSHPDSEDASAAGLDRWTGQAKWQLLSYKGHVVRQTGSAVVMEFADPRSCLQAAFNLRQMPEADGRPPLRAAAHLARHSTGDAERDIKLLSGLAQQARPGEVLVTAELRDRLADGLDADFEDLGHRRPKPGARAVRLFQAHRTEGDPVPAATRDLRPGLAVIPFKGSLAEARRWVIGDLIAEGVIARLSHSLGIRVISRHSTAALRDCAQLEDVERHLGAAFVLSGSYGMDGRKLVVTAELAEARTHTLLWSGKLRHSLDDLLNEQSELLHELAHTVAQALTKAQVRQALAKPLPRLDSSQLLLAGVSMAHSHSAKTFARGHEVLFELAARHPELALPKAWLAMWHTLNVVKGHSGNVALDTHLAREYALRALDAEPSNAMALAIDGHIHCQLLGDPAQARHSLDAAIEANPSEPMAWLFKSLYSGMWGSSTAAVTEACIARSLSPVDPLRYFFDMLMGNALYADGQAKEALVYAKRSVRANKHHAPGLRLLVISQVESGQLDEARETLRLLLAEAPKLTVASYLAMGSNDSPMRQRAMRALRQAGLPER